MSLLYLLAVLVATTCMGLVDHRWRLVLFDRPWRTAVVLLAGIGYLLVWDLVAIGMEVYRRGESPAMTGLEVVPELPVEELFFVLFLCYLTLVLHALFLMLLQRREVVE